MRWSASTSLFVLLMVVLAGSILTAEDGKKSGKNRSWGEVVDPDGDCKFAFGKRQLVISIPTGVHGMSVERGRVNAPRVWDNVTGDFVAQVKVSGNFPEGAQSLVATRKAFQGAGLIAWENDDTYIRLERAGMVAGSKTFSYTSFELRQGGRWVRQGTADEHPLRPDLPTWLRLERRGDTLRGTVSQDGEEWIELDAIQLPLKPHLKVGVMAGHNTTQALEVTFEDYELRPSE